jgi:hypothetical protein
VIAGPSGEKSPFLSVAPGTVGAGPATDLRLRAVHAGVCATSGDTLTKGRPMAETYNGYCVKCKEKRDFEGEVHETNGRRMAKGICPVCGTKMNRILGKA